MFYSFFFLFNFFSYFIFWCEKALQNVYFFGAIGYPTTGEAYDKITKVIKITILISIFKFLSQTNANEYVPKYKRV